MGSAGRFRAWVHWPRRRVIPRRPRRAWQAWSSHEDQEVGVCELHVAFDEGQHHGDLDGLGVAVLGRAPGENVGDVERAGGVGGGAVEADMGDHEVEELAGAADEGFALEILVPARGLRR